MKKIFTYSATLILATLIFYGGAGINFISYCCNDCRSEGVQAVINDKCCEIHHHQHDDVKCCDNNHFDDHPCCDINHFHADKDHTSGDCCSFARVSFDWSVHLLPKQVVDPTPILPEALSNNLLFHLSADWKKISKNNLNEPHSPPLLLPRDYLSILTVLLI